MYVHNVSLELCKKQKLTVGESRELIFTHGNVSTTT